MLFVKARPSVVRFCAPNGNLLVINLHRQYYPKEECFLHRTTLKWTQYNESGFYTLVKKWCAQDGVSFELQKTLNFEHTVSLPVCKNHTIYRTTFVLILNNVENIPLSRNIIVVHISFKCIPHLYLKTHTNKHIHTIHLQIFWTLLFTIAKSSASSRTINRQFSLIASSAHSRLCLLLLSKATQNLGHY